MTNGQILQKAVEKAVKNGYKPSGLLGGVLKGEIGVGMDPNIYNHLTNIDNQYYVYIFSHDFAKAVWKHLKECDIPEEFCSRHANWQYHLQQMVLEENPLKYLKKFI